MRSRWIRSLAISVLTLGAVAMVVYAAGGRIFSPGALNAEARDGVQLGGVRSHAEIDGQCSACHAAPWSRTTMAARCLNCHSDVRTQIDAHAPLHGKMADAMQCRTCHSEHNGPHAALTSLEQFDHDMAAFPLTGKHRDVECQGCHKSKVFLGTPQRCVTCHADPVVHKGKFGTECSQCHSTATWKSTSGMNLAKGTFSHNTTGFPLTGKHSIVECKSCHVSNVFKGTAKTCASCHAEPQVHRGKFGTECGSCHTTATWKNAGGALADLQGKFNHDLAAFKLTGMHKMVECAACHKNNMFKGTAQSCSACHAEPVVHKGKFGSDCVHCHSTATWKNTGDAVGWLKENFNHELAAFKLTGKHKTVDCAACHVNNVFKGAAQTCVKCHAEPQVHKGKFGQECAQCHSTETWKGAKFKHTFPLDHGRRGRVIECVTCHNKPNDMKAYTCYGCHEHEEARIARKHPKLNAMQLQNCVKCHPTGRENERRGGERERERERDDDGGAEDGALERWLKQGDRFAIKEWK
ncbi:MAG TPA: hypothetical protein VKS79_07150 [Gemmataceae bacterium]|nr:hypothetical protein [Gemmataceae bacterium]